MSLKILFLSMEYAPDTGNGIGSYLSIIAPALAARGNDVHVLSCVSGQEERDYNDQGASIHRRGQLRLRGLGRVPVDNAATERLRTALSCYREYRRLPICFDVVEAPDWMAEGFILALLRSKPLVGCLHTPLCLVRHYNEQAHRAGLADFLERVTMRRADLLTAPSCQIVRNLVEVGWLGDDSPVIIRYPIDMRRWTGLEHAGATRRVVLQVGRVEPRKGPEILIRAVGELAPQIDGVELVFVGRSAQAADGRCYRDQMRDLAVELSVTCRFVEEVPRVELEKWYASARVAVVASRFENFSMAGLEAMASGRPLVCTSTTGNAELIRFSQAGTIIPPEDPHALAAALRPYLLDSEHAAHAGREAQRLAQVHCSSDTIAAQRETSYREAIARAGKLMKLV